ncbi:MAG: DUF4157 domain-containing protein [Parabacteroides sp.]|nr:DUF4157 domain-containing protein [Parabacteroides sp.]
MNAEKQFTESQTRILSSTERKNALSITDNRPQAIAQAKMIEAIQRAAEDDDKLLQGKFALQRNPEEEELLQGKFTSQRATEDDDELLQGKFDTAQRESDNQTGMPGEIKQKMENSLGTDFSSVRVHPDSAKAPEVGALAYTQGTDIHFAPGQFKPDTTTGQQLLGHELAHVIQQEKGLVQPTTEIGGMAVNDDASLEHEADVLGNKAANS